jgi:hypothetical protein
MLERRRAVALSCHFRDAEGLSIAQIAYRVGRAPATIKAYFDEPTGETARAVKARSVGVCRGCGAYNGRHQMLPPAGGCASSCGISAASSSLMLTKMDQTTLRATPP